MKLIYQGDKLAAAVLDSEEEIRAATFALRLAQRQHSDLDHALSRMLAEITAPAPNDGRPA